MVMKAVIMRHLFIFSVAMNFGLFFKVFNDEQQKAKGALMEDAPQMDFHAMKRIHLEKTSSSVGIKVKDDGHTIINLNQGDPTMYESYWQQMGNKATIVISGWESISYFSDKNNLCWFLEPKFASAVIKLHQLVGNAVVKDRHIVVGTGSSQLYQAVLFALCSSNNSEPMSVVSASPFYSSYPSMTDFLKSGLYHWAGDAYKFDEDKPYIELVTSPNNPDGSIRQPVVSRSRGGVIHDLAYYWPQYTPITSPADHEIMLFTVSKSTGHAGSRIGWALVKDAEIAKKMTKFMEINTIGVSKDSQLRAAKILEVIYGTYHHNPFFEYGSYHMEKRWRLLREVVDKGNLFSLPNFLSERCTFSGRDFAPRPAFAWLKCEQTIEDCGGFLSQHHIHGRSGDQFGVSKEYVRISMVDRDDIFYRLIQRLSTIISNNSKV